MTDIATKVIQHELGTSFDWLLSGPDLNSDDGMKSAVIISIFTDRLAAADDVLPNVGDDRRGWWGDLAVGAAASQSSQDLIGSRLWLLQRAKATTKTAALARRYIIEALQWLISDGVARSVSVQTRWVGIGTLEIALVIGRLSRNGTIIDHRFDLVWNATLAQPLSSRGLPPPPVLLTEQGDELITEGGDALDL